LRWISTPLAQEFSITSPVRYRGSSDWPTMTERVYINHGYDDDLRRLRVQVIMMGGRVETLVGASVRALTQRDPGLARQTIESDRAVDQHEIAIDGLCREILELRQPVASDVRFVTGALRLATDLERIADLGVSISRSALALCAEAPLQPEVGLARMASEVESMLHEALDAFLAGDASKAEQVIARDQLIDNLSAQIFCELFTHVVENARCITQVLWMQSVAKHLERIGDHVTYLGELVVAMVRGEDICHGAKSGGSMRAVPYHERN
jgi:phosphate transport system protein